MDLNANTAALLASKIDQLRDLRARKLMSASLEQTARLAEMQPVAHVKRECLLALAAEALLLAETIEAEAQAQSAAIDAMAEEWETALYAK